jgi:hypothetical protein
MHISISARTIAARIVRRCAGAPPHTAIYVDRESPLMMPRYVGEPPRYETPAGQIVRHQSAYRRAYGRPVYVASTLRVLVGSAVADAAVEGAQLGLTYAVRLRASERPCRRHSDCREHPAIGLACARSKNYRSKK